MESASPQLSLISRARSFGERAALLTPEGIFTYKDLIRESANAATALLTGRDDLSGERICYLVPPSWEYTVVQWAVWRAGGLGVPMAISHPEAELAWVLEDAQPEAVIVHPSLEERLRDLTRDRQIPLLLTPALLRDGPTAQLPAVEETRQR